MNQINQFRDAETQRMQRNLTQTQKKNITSTKEGVLVNSFFKEPIINLNDTCDNLVISNSAMQPIEINENKNIHQKSILPIAGVTVGVMGAIAGLTNFIKNNTKIVTQMNKANKLADTPRNIALNEETHQAIFRMVQCPTRKTVIAGTGVLALTAMAFMGKTFLDGFKEVWVKKKEADIQKDLQEKLINVETKSFSGKIKIIRNMMSEKAAEFSQILCPKNGCKRVMFDGHTFKGNLDKTSKTSSQNNTENNLKFFALGVATVAGIGTLGYASLKNLGKSKKYLENYITKTKNEIGEIVNKSTSKTKDNDIIQIKERFQSIDAKPEFMNKTLSKTNWSKDEKEDIVFEITKSSVHANSAIGGDGRGKPSFYSHVDDYRAFFYNWLLDPSNKQFRNLFAGITGATALAYGGKVAGEAIKDVQVKKINANTEFELQKRLVSTDLRNFKSKKEAAIEPLCEEFYNQLHKGKPKPELKIMADSILFDIKNGPPFVYS